MASEKVKPAEPEHSMGLPGAGGGGDEEMLVRGYKLHYMIKFWRSSVHCDDS